MTIPPEFYDNLDRMCGLLTKQIELYGELKRSCRIADLLGVPPKELKGTVSMGVYDGGAPRYARPWRTRELVIRRDGAEAFRAKLIDVHQDLWPDDVRAEYERHQKQQSRYARRIIKENQHATR